MIKFTKNNIGSNSFSINAYEASFEGYFRGTSFNKVRITKDSDGWSIRVNIATGKMGVLDFGYDTLKEAKEEATAWEVK